MILSIQSIKFKKLSSVLLLSILTIPSAGFASENLTSSSNRTISYQLTEEPDQAIKNSELKDSELVINEKQVYQAFRKESTDAAIMTSYTDHLNHFSIFNASTDLISDFDYDGFYHRFRVTIDADTVYPSAHIYAKLYLSYEGGPWDYYASSNTYHINGDSSLDSFAIETELADGYPAGYYDIRIELYDADYGEFLMAYGPYDNYSLSALPLEDSYKDDVYEAENVSYATDIYVTGSGSMNWWTLLLLAGLIAVIRDREIKRI